MDAGQLEQLLLVLGRRERDLEDSLQALRAHARQCAAAKQFSDADRAIDLYEAKRRELAALQVDVTKVENQLYRLRRKP